MYKFYREKKFNVILLGGVLIVASLAWVQWQFYCTSDTCDLYFIRGTLKPLIFGFSSLSLILASLLIFPSKLFKHWLYHIAIWSIPLAVLLVLDEDPRSSSILSFGRGLLSWTLGTLIFILTVLYTLGWHLFGFSKGIVVKKDLLKLLVFIPAALAFYVIWQLF